jgi:large subunit ribosomal protein L21
MYAIVDIAGQQFKVEQGKKIYVHRLKADEGASIQFDKVLLLSDDKGGIKTGNNIGKAMVKAHVLTHLKGDKVIVFKKKRRKGYKVKNGHRQYLTQIQIDEIAA